MDVVVVVVVVVNHSCSLLLLFWFCLLPFVRVAVIIMHLRHHSRCVLLRELV